MKYCSKCGAQIHDEAVVCPNCGCATENFAPPKAETKTIGILAIIFGALGGLLGLILGIYGVCTYKDPANKRNCIIGICLFGVWIILGIIFSNMFIDMLATYFPPA